MALENNNIIDTKKIQVPTEPLKKLAGIGICKPKKTKGRLGSIGD